MIAHMMGCEFFSEFTDEKLDKKKAVKKAQHFDAMDVYNKVRYAQTKAETNTTDRNQVG